MTDSPLPLPQFPATRWSMVLAASGNGESARAALEELCRLYWFPLYAFSRQRGCSAEDAEDETQNFLVRVASEELFSRAQPDRGRLRTYLLRAFERDLIDSHRRSQRLKRGAGREVLPLDAIDAETLFLQTPLQASAVATYDRLWAVACLETTVQCLEAEYAERGRSQLFANLRPFLDPEGDQCYAGVAEATGLESNAIRQAVFRLRQRFRALLRQTVADTLDKPTEALIEDELAALRAALS